MTTIRRALSRITIFDARRDWDEEPLSRSGVRATLYIKDSEEYAYIAFNRSPKFVLEESMSHYVGYPLIGSKDGSVKYTGEIVEVKNNSGKLHLICDPKELVA